MRTLLVVTLVQFLSVGWGFSQEMTFDQIRQTLGSELPATGDQALREQAILALDAYLKPYEPETRPAVAEFYSRMVSTLPYELSQPVATGARIWKVYNHGFIVKTPSRVLAFDLIPFNAGVSFVPNEVLDQIDVLFVSHNHGDHSNPPLQNTVRRLGGEVLTTSNFSLDTPTVVAGMDVIAHYGQHNTSNYIFDITTPEGLRLMHTGDTQHSRWVPDGENIDIMMVNAWMNESGGRSATTGVRNAVVRAAPQLTLTGHEHEMQHTYNPSDVRSRVPYEWPLAVDDEDVPGIVSVTTWGERYDYQVEPLEYRPPAELQLVIDSLYSDSDNDTDSNFDGQGDRVRDQRRRSRTSVGETDSGNANEVSRAFAKFALPAIPDGQAASQLKQATLKLFLEEIEGVPAGPVSVLHSVSDNAPVPSGSGSLGRFEDPTYVDTELDLVGPGDEVGRYFEVDVTRQVLTDFDADGFGAIASFRLQIDADSFVEDGQGHRYQFSMMGSSTNPPQLLLTFVPEPTTFSLALMAVAMTGWVRRRRV